MPVLFICLLALLAPPAGASAPPLFDDDTALELELAGPFRSLFADNNRDERDFKLTAGGVAHAIRVRTRGNSRSRLCRFPPLRLNFSTRDTAGTVFEGQDKLRLVTHCKTSPGYEQNVLEEYAAYRIFRLFAHAAYTSRLLRITYIDTDRAGKAAPITRYAFVLESDDELNRRIGARPAEVSLVSRSKLNARQEAMVYVFQYLIGNTDWSLVTAWGDEYCCHNGRLKRIGPELFYVPFDFDLAGLVNARYARPDSSLRINRVTQRLYRGHCTSREVLREALRAVAARRADIVRVMRDLPVVVDRDARKSRQFVDAFFTLAADEEALLDAFERRCR